VLPDVDTDDGCVCFCKEQGLGQEKEAKQATQRGKNISMDPDLRW